MKSVLPLKYQVRGQTFWPAHSNSMPFKCSLKRNVQLNYNVSDKLNMKTSASNISLACHI